MNCPHCGMIHQTTCPRIKEIEYYPDGIVVKRIEFHPPHPIIATNPLRDFVVGKNTAGDVHQ